MVARRSAGRGVREMIECPLPALFSVDLGYHAPRLPAYKDRQKAGSKPIRKLAFAGEKLPNKIRSAGLSTPRPRPKRVPSPDSSLEAFDRIEQLLAGSRIEKKGTILRTDPASQVEGIIHFLKEHGFVPLKK